MGTVKDSSEIDRNVNITQIFPINSDPGKYERLRKEYLYGKGPNTLISAVAAIWRKFLQTDKRISDIEDRLKELDGIAMPRHIASPPNIAEYHIKQFLPDDEE